MWGIQQLYGYSYLDWFRLEPDPIGHLMDYGGIVAGDTPDLLNLLDLILFGSDLNLEHALNNLRYHTSLIRLIAQEGKENKPLLVLIVK